MQINKVELNLLDYEIDIILDALLEYCNINNQKYNFRRISKTENESNEKFLIRNTYEHIQNCKSRKMQKETIKFVNEAKAI